MKNGNAPFYKRGVFWSTVAIVTALVALVVYLNLSLAGRTEKIWIRSEGQLRLSNITSSVENNLNQAENYASSYAAQLELMMKENVSLEDDMIYDFIRSQNRMLSDKTLGQCFSTYIAYQNKLFIEDFIPDESFHLTERVWYVGAKKNQGRVYITAPYIDASTGNMCYSVSLLLDDGETIVGLDFYMDEIQKYIEQMNEQIDGISMIINEGGMIVGHTDSSLLGEDYTVLKDYRELIEKVFNLYGNYFEYRVGTNESIKYTVFSDKTTYGWYLIVCLPSSEISSGAGLNTFIGTAIMILLWACFIVIYIIFCRRQDRMEERLLTKENQIAGMYEKLRKPVTDIAQQIHLSEGGEADFRENLLHLADELKQNLDNLASLQNYSGVELDFEDPGERIGNKSNKYKHYSFAIIGVLVLASVISIAVNSYTQYNYIRAYMENEGEIYYSQTKSWIDTNITLTNDLALHLGAQPDLYKDYEKAVKYLDDVVKDNADISVAYIVNPSWEHTVIMNNGWESTDPDWHVEERQWYVDTILSENGFNISTPYQDSQTGMYCVTFSQIVYDEHGNIVGLIGIDFYMDTLINILGESYTSDGYAFLTDPSYIILNHPYEPYQMALDHSVSGAETEYRSAIVSESLTLMKDYNNRYVVTLAQREPRAGFTVITVRNAWLIYGTLVITDVILAFVFLVSILFVLIITKYMSKQQEELNEELRMAADKAIAAGRAKSQFLAQMSHEIRTPINAVLGMNEMILRESKEEAILEYASNAYNAGNALLSIINDVLDISKIEAGKLEIVNAEYDMYSLVSDCYHMTADRAAKKGLKYTVNVDEELPTKLYGDMFHLRQIIVNFITNAIKYSNEGSVELRFAGKETEKGFALSVSVKDTGIGLTEESMGKLFTSFQRFDLERNQSVEGTGLGLSICKQLAELMGGTVEVESIYGKGSTFTCTVPQKVISADPVGTVTLHRQGGHQGVMGRKKFKAPTVRLLVVDDVEMNLTVFSSLLKDHEFIIDKAQSGKRCLELVQQQTYDVIFMDHMMPEMDGMETFAQMGKMEHLNQNTPVVMLTANAISGEREKYLEAGFSTYLTKPIQSDKLDEVLLKYLSKEKIQWIEEDSADEPKDKDLIKEESAENKEYGVHASLIDVTLGFSYFGGNEEAYMTILESYLKESAKRREDISSFYNEKDWKNYVTAVHALKSTSLNIGAKNLSERAKELELAGKAENYDLILEKNDALLEEFRKVITAAETVLNKLRADLAEELHAKEGEGEGPRELKDISEAELKDYVEQIQKAADDFDLDEILELCGELSGCRYEGRALKDVVKEIKEAADDFDYGLAKEKAAALLKG